MEYWKKVARRISRTGLLGVGLLGLFLAHKKHIPEYMNPVSYGMTCVGIYVLATYFLDNDEDDSDKDKVETSRIIAENVMDYLKPALESYISETPKHVREKNFIGRRNFLKEFEEDTKWIFEKRPDEETHPNKQELSSFQKMLLKASNMSQFRQTGETDEVLDLLNKCSEELAKIRAEDEGENIVQTSPILVKLQEAEARNINTRILALSEYFEKMSNKLQLDPPRRCYSIDEPITLNSDKVEKFDTIPSSLNEEASSKLYEKPSSSDTEQELGVASSNQEVVIQSSLNEEASSELRGKPSSSETEQMQELGVASSNQEVVIPSSLNEEASSGLSEKPSSSDAEQMQELGVASSNQEVAIPSSLNEEASSDLSEKPPSSDTEQMQELGVASSNPEKEIPID